MSEPDPTAYGRRAADVYDELYETTLPTGPAVRALAGLAAGGPVLELGIGTGRLALPLAAQGLEVHGVDASAEMLEQLRAKPGGAALPAVQGDFTSVRLPTRFSLVVLAFNTIVAVPDQEAQIEVFRTAAEHLLPGGAFVVETWVPDLGAFRRGQSVRLLSVSEQQVLVEAAELHSADQTMRTTKVLLTDAGVRLLPANHRYAWPAELDLMARLAGLRPESRWADWEGAPFTDGSPAHVSVYRRP